MLALFLQNLRDYDAALTGVMVLFFLVLTLALARTPK